MMKNHVNSPRNGKRLYKDGKVPKLLVNNKAALPQQLSNDEKSKHQFYIQRNQDDVIIKDFLFTSGPPGTILHLNFVETNLTFI